MRLLEVESRRIVEFSDDDIPKYIILSHTWGKHEITFADCRTERGRELVCPRGSVKIDGCCEMAKKRDLQYVWLDTICIDKSSSAELSEAINSMYAWYQKAETCLVYMEDVPSCQGWELEQADSPFRKSRWFKRGWTLQEMLAPLKVLFFSNSWELLATRNSYERRYFSVPGLIGGIASSTKILSEITGIDENYLYGDESRIRRASVATKMHWAAGRLTTRVEDRAYSLLGLFDVNMPMLYGEGEKAFQRLLKEIIIASDDETVFTGGYDLPVTYRASIFPRSPDDFQSQTLVPKPNSTTQHYFLTNKGLRIETSVVAPPELSGTLLARLNVEDAAREASDDGIFSIPLVPTHRSDTYTTPITWVPSRVPASLFKEAIPSAIYIQPSLRHYWSIFQHELDIEDATDFKILEVYPSCVILISKVYHYMSISIPDWFRAKRVPAIYARLSLEGQSEFALKLALRWNGLADTGIFAELHVTIAAMRQGRLFLGVVLDESTEWTETLELGEVVLKLERLPGYKGSYKLCRLSANCTDATPSE